MKTIKAFSTGIMLISIFRIMQIIYTEGFVVVTANLLNMICGIVLFCIGATILGHIAIFLVESLDT